MKKLSKVQVQILRALDGALAPVEYTGVEKRSLDILKERGLVTYRAGSRNASTYYYTRFQTVYFASLTKQGSEFILNGGIDY